MFLSSEASKSWSNSICGNRKRMQLPNHDASLLLSFQTRQRWKLFCLLPREPAKSQQFTKIKGPKILGKTVVVKKHLFLRCPNWAVLKGNENVSEDGDSCGGLMPTLWQTQHVSPSLELNGENNSNKGLVGPPKQSTDGSIQLQGRYSQHILLCARYRVGMEQGLG